MGCDGLLLWGWVCWFVWLVGATHLFPVPPHPSPLPRGERGLLVGAGLKPAPAFAPPLLFGHLLRVAGATGIVWGWPSRFCKGLVAGESPAPSAAPGIPLRSLRSRVPFRWAKGDAKGLRRPPPLWMDVPSRKRPAFAGMTLPVIGARFRFRGDWRVFGRVLIIRVASVVIMVSMVRIRIAGCGGWRPPVSGRASGGVWKIGAGGSCGACSAVIATAAFIGRRLVVAQTIGPSIVMIRLDVRMVRFPSPCSSCAMLTLVIRVLSSSGSGKHVLAGFSSRYSLSGNPALSVASTRCQCPASLY